jgi:hypothetical protein
VPFACPLVATQAALHLQRHRTNHHVRRDRVRRQWFASERRGRVAVCAACEPLLNRRAFVSDAVRRAHLCVVGIEGCDSRWHARVSSVQADAPGRSSALLSAGTSAQPPAPIRCLPAPLAPSPQYSHAPLSLGSTDASGCVHCPHLARRAHRARCTGHDCPGLPGLPSRQRAVRGGVVTSTERAVRGGVVKSLRWPAPGQRTVRLG